MLHSVPFLNFNVVPHPGMLLEIRDIYRRGAAVAQDAASRDFCRYMLRRIEDSLRVS